MTRQLAGGTDHAVLVPTGSGFSATFPSITVNCTQGTPPRPDPSVHGVQIDHLTLRWPSNGTQLTGTESVTSSGCGSNVVAGWTSDLSAVAVGHARAPTITPNPAHAATAKLFVAAAGRVCAHVDALLKPIATRITGALSTLRTTRSRSAAASAAAAVAGLYPRLVPLAATEYMQIPQPPPGPLAALWLHSLEVERQVAAQTADWAAAISHEYLAVRQFVLTRSQLAAQDATAYATLAAIDTGPLKTLTASSNTIKHRLQLPAACTQATTG
jgi:hypothetical protein